MSNNSIKPLERNITIGAVVLGLAAFPFILGKCQLTDSISSNVSDTLIKTVSIDVPTEKASDSDDIARLKAELDQAFGREEVLQAELTDARNKYYSIQQQMKQLDADYDSRLNAIQTPQTVIVKEEVVVEKTAPDPQLALLTTQLSDLKSSSSTSLSELQSKLDKTTQELADTTKQSNAQQEKIKELNELLSKDNTAAREQKINAAINELREENTKLRRHEKKMKQDALAANKEWEVKLQESLAPYKGEIKDLKAQLGLLRSQSVFATSADDLNDKSGILFKRLQGLEGQSSTELTESYKAIDTELNSNDMTRVKFGTGSVSLDAASTAKINAVLKDIKADDSFLIVGYASNQGDKKLNERLSSNRAKAVAEKVLSEIGSENSAQAVYLGETTRFGATAENQCVEIWKIRK